MEVCSVCVKNSFFSEKYGNVSLCKICSMKILSPAWKNKKYKTNDEVENQKQKVLNLANNNNFVPEVMEGISAFFESKKIEGLIKVFNGHKRQILTVCETYCIIDTTAGFDYMEAEKAYLRLMKNGKRGGSASSNMLDGIINNQTAVNIIGGVVGGIVPGGGILKRQITKAGKNIVKNAVANHLSGGESQVNNRENQIILHVQTGERVIKYTNYDIVKFIEPVGEEEYGFIKLQNSKYEHNSEEDVVFFFSQGTETKKEAGQLYAFIRNEVDEINKALVDSQKLENAAQVQQVAANVQQVNTSIIADELLKFKQLLDMGAINQQEYEEMKKRLLGM
jgi:hypothetical protein